MEKKELEKMLEAHQNYKSFTNDKTYNIRGKKSLSGFIADLVATTRNLTVAQQKQKEETKEAFWKFCMYHAARCLCGCNNEIYSPALKRNIKVWEGYEPVINDAEKSEEDETAENYEEFEEDENGQKDAKIKSETAYTSDYMDIVNDIVVEIMTKTREIQYSSEEFEKLMGASDVELEKEVLAVIDDLKKSFRDSIQNGKKLNLQYWVRTRAKKYTYGEKLNNNKIKFRKCEEKEDGSLEIVERERLPAAVPFQLENEDGSWDENPEIFETPEYSLKKGIINYAVGMESFGDVVSDALQKLSYKDLSKDEVNIICYFYNLGSGYKLKENDFSADEKNMYVMEKYAAIADKLGKSTEYVQSHLKKAIKILGDYIKKNYSL